MYRAAAWLTISTSTPSNSRSEIVEIINTHNIRIFNGATLVDDLDISGKIRTDLVGDIASIISAYPEVRKALVPLQRSYMQENYTLVAEGRDMGTVVFPDAFLKIYVIADIACRAMRRFKYLRGNNEGISFDKVVKALLKRDRRDRSRSDSPLKRATDAYILDTTRLSVGEQVQIIIDLFNITSAGIG